MKLSDVIKKYGDFEITDEMVKTFDPEFKPNNGEWYWAISPIGVVQDFTWIGDEFDSSFFEKRNVYRTKEEANWCRDTSFCQFPPFYYPTCDAVKEVIHRYTFDELAECYGRV